MCEGNALSDNYHTIVKGEVKGERLGVLRTRFIREIREIREVREIREKVSG